MSTMGRRSVALGAIFLTLVCFSAILLGTPTPVPPQKGDTTPTKKRIVVYFHFAPDGCENCAGLAPKMQQFYEEHGSEYDVRGIVITHWGRHDATAVKKFVRTHGITFPIIGFASLASNEPPNPDLASGFLPQGTQRERSRATSPPSAVINANTRQHPVVQVYNPETRVTRVASVGDVSYRSMVDQIQTISSGGTGSPLQGST
jgi:thiol-disulfide isomerase/thioredoxin